MSSRTEAMWNNHYEVSQFSNKEKWTVHTVVNVLKWSSTTVFHTNPQFFPTNRKEKITLASNAWSLRYPEAWRSSKRQDSGWITECNRKLPSQSLIKIQQNIINLSFVPILHALEYDLFHKLKQLLVITHKISLSFPDKV